MILHRQQLFATTPLKLSSFNESYLTISDIAYRSGFNNRNSFYKVFKDKTGITPSQYKKSLAQ